MDLTADRKYGFLEASTDTTKTSEHGRRMGRELPLVAYARWLNGRPWAERWLQVRRRAGLNVAWQTVVRPTPKLGAGWTMRHLGTEDSKTLDAVHTHEAWVLG